MQNILIATDGSPGGAAAVEAGIELAQAAGADVTLLYVREPIRLLGEPFYQRKLSRQLAEARRALDSGLELGERYGVHATAETLEGDPASEIAAVAEVRNVDLVVVGSRGHGGMTAALLGSVSSALARGSGRPVLVVKEPVHAGNRVDGRRHAGAA